MKPFLAPSNIPASDTANVCIVMGTPYGIGILICASTTVSAVKRAIKLISRVFIFFPNIITPIT
ncbi:hypothetical protein FACS1894167_05510 [Synergistales bacterium]|nr:hypothetical protein FACS1894167_05510 [Synergistales bacterium]